MSRASPAKGAIRRVGQISRHLGAASPLLADGQNGLKSHGIPLSGVRYIASSAVPPPASNIQGLLTRTEFSAHPRWQTGVKSFFANSIPANTSIEDAWSVQKEAIQGDGELERAYVTVTDGHLGPLAAQVVARYLPSYIAKEFSRMSVVAKTEAKEDADGHDSAIMRKCNAIVSAYKRLDNDICRGGIPAPPDMPVQSLALQGACCISAVVDPEQNGIFVAGAGDCRALIGKRSASGSWEMVEMSRDHTLRDADELQRVLDEHPGEPRHILANQGRVLGSLMPSRAFGDSDFKWDRETQQKLGSTLFPPQIYRSPPYMTAEPDVFFFPYAHDAGSSGPGSVPPPDGGFLILASDGLWDNISSGRAAALIAGLIESKTDFMQVNPATALIREAFSGGAYSRGDARGLKRADDLLSIPLGAARNYRDDVTVVVCFLTSPNTLWTAEYAADVDGARIDDGVTTVDADGMGGDKPERITEWMSQNSS